MTTYQKVLVCIFRSIGILGLGYLLLSIGTSAVTSAMMMPGMFKMSLIMMIPLMIPSLVLLLAAVPLAKLVTIGIED